MRLLKKNRNHFKKEELAHIANIISENSKIYEDLAMPYKFIKHQQQALSIFQEIGDPLGMCRSLYSLGIVHSDLGKFEDAIISYNRGLELVSGLAERHLESRMLSDLGEVYAKLKKSDKAIDYYQQALPIIREIGNREDERRVLERLGSAYLDFNKIQDAIECNKQSIAIARELSDREAEAYVNWNLGLAYKEADELERAVEVMQLCLDYEHEIGDTNVDKDEAFVNKIRLEIIVKEGVKKKRQGDYNGAKETYYRAIKIDPTDLKAFYALGKICYLNGELDEAIRNYLRTAHLSIYNQIQIYVDTPEYEFSMQQTLNLPLDFLQELYQVHRFAKYLLLDGNTPRHLGHAILDFARNTQHNIPNSDWYIERYADAISGTSGFFGSQIVMNEYEHFCTFAGVRYLLTHLRWDRIEDNQVLNFY